MSDKIIITKMEKLISGVIDAQDLADHLEKVLWGYALYTLADDEICGHPDNIRSLYWCKELLEVLKSKENK